MKARTKAAKIRTKRGRPIKMEPGRSILPEDRRAVFTTMRIRRYQSSSRVGRIDKTEASFEPRYVIERRLMRAMKTIRALPDKDRRFFVMKGASIPYVQEYMDAYNSSDIRAPAFVPTPQDISDCLTALSWVRHVDNKCWKIMWLRSFDFSFGLISKYIGKSDETARRWYREGIIDAWSAANGL